MADKEKKKKTKKTEEAEAPAEAPKSPSGSARTSRGSRKVKRSGSSVFSCFSQKQVAEFKEGFSLIDHDKDGFINKNDLRFIFDQVGRISSEKELDEMLAEVSGPVNFTQWLNLFATRMGGGGGAADDDQTITNAFMKFDQNGKINGEKLRRQIMTFGDKFTIKEWNEASDHFYIDDKGMIDTESLINMLCGKEADEEE